MSQMLPVRTPQSDSLKSDPRGTARIFRCQKGAKLPVSEADLYQYRGVYLRELNYDEWTMMVELAKYQAGDEETADGLEAALLDPPRDREGGPGRRANLRCECVRVH